MTVANQVLEFFRSRVELPGSQETALTYTYVDDPEMDSMAIVQLIVAFEEQFGINFTNDDLESDDIQTVGGIIRIIDGHLGQAHDA